MAKSFDFNRMKPRTMTVTLSDEKKTTLIVKTPNKALRDELVGIKESVEDAEEEEVWDALYELAAKVMSRNKEDIKITAVQLKELYEDVNYITAFLEAYTDFVNELSDLKN